MKKSTNTTVILIIVGCILLLIMLSLIVYVCFFAMKGHSPENIPVSPQQTEPAETQLVTVPSEGPASTVPSSETLPSEENSSSAALPKEIEIPLEFELSGLKWKCISEQVPDAYSVNQSYQVWIPEIEGPKDVLVMMHTNHNPVENTGFPSDWTTHTYWENGYSWVIGDALAALAKDHPFILISPHYTCWADKEIPSNLSGTDFLIPDIHIKFLKDICSKYDTYADPTEESIQENRSHFFLGGASMGANWTSQGITSGLSPFYGNFIIASDSTQYQMPLEDLITSLKQIDLPTNVWCVNGSMEGDHTAVTWDHLKEEEFNSVTPRHIYVLEGQHRYSTWIAALDTILSKDPS